MCKNKRHSRIFPQYPNPRLQLLLPCHAPYKMEGGERLFKIVVLHKYFPFPLLRLQLLLDSSLLNKLTALLSKPCNYTSLIQPLFINSFAIRFSSETLTNDVSFSYKESDFTSYRVILYRITYHIISQTFHVNCRTLRRLQPYKHSSFPFDVNRI